MIYNSTQQEIGRKIEKGLDIPGWKNWKWQPKHSIRSLEKSEFLTSITPCYLSLIHLPQNLDLTIWRNVFSYRGLKAGRTVSVTGCLESVE
ncbi:MAG TPA: hypothetical protein ENO20_07980 [Bacteroides sp.]|nr:hypothetical protein [Bacteroides sp.]